MEKQHLIDLENKFWQSIVDQDADTAVTLLSEPAVMVSTHGAMQFDHAGYRKMAEQGSMTVSDYEFSDMQVVFPDATTAVMMYHVRQTLVPRGKKETIVQDMIDTSTWVKGRGDDWRCVMHTETPAQKH